MTTAASPGAGDSRISLTAYATASAWARYGFAEAHWFDTRRGRAFFAGLHWATRAASPVIPTLGDFWRTLYWRHRWFNDWVERRAPALAVEIGAGLSARGMAYARAHANTRWLDLDLPGIVAARRALLGDRPMPANYRLAEGDLLAPALAPNLTAPAHGPVIAMTEGVLDYLNMAQKARAWRAVAALLRRLGGGRYLCDIHPLTKLPPRGAKTLGALLRRSPRRPPPPPIFAAPEQALEMLRDCGFCSARVYPEAERGEAAAAPAEKRRFFTLVEAEI